jgi:hypothetical protein
MPQSEYAATLDETLELDYIPRFADQGIDAPWNGSSAAAGSAEVTTLLQRLPARKRWRRRVQQYRPERTRHARETIR